MTLHMIRYCEGFPSKASAEYALFSRTRLGRANQFILDTLNKLGGCATLEGTRLTSTCVQAEDGVGWDLLIQGNYEIIPG